MFWVTKIPSQTAEEGPNGQHKPKRSFFLQCSAISGAGCKTRTNHKSGKDRSGAIASPPFPRHPTPFLRCLLSRLWSFLLWDMRTAQSSLVLTSRLLCTFRGPGLMPPVLEGRLDRVAGGSSLFFAFSHHLTPLFGFIDFRLTRTHVSNRLLSDAT